MSPLREKLFICFFWDWIQRERDLVRQVSRKPGYVSSFAPGTTCLVYNLHRKYPAWQIPCRQCPEIPFWSWTFQFSKVTDLFRDQRGYSVSLWSLKNIWHFSANYLSIFMISLSSWGKEDLGCTGGPPLPRSPLPTQIRPCRSCRHLPLCRFSGWQGSSHGSNLYSPARGHSAQIRGKWNHKDPIREHFMASLHRVKNAYIKMQKVYSQESLICFTALH